MATLTAELTTEQVIDLLDGLATYRQLDHWCRKGHLHHRTPNPGRGTPNYRQWNTREVLEARALAISCDASIDGPANQRGRLVPIIANHIRTAPNLTRKLDIPAGRVTITLDLTLNSATEPALADWILN